MKKISLLIGVILMCIALQAFAEEPVALEISEWRPYVYMEDGQPKGFSYDIVKTLFERANIQYDFQIKPWARVYKNGLEKKNYFIPGLGRTLKREPAFQWIGPLTKGIDIYFYKLKTDAVQIRNLDEAKEYSVGVERGSYYQDFLEAHFPKDKRQPVSQPDQLLKILMAKRVKFILLDEARMLKIAEKLGVDANLFEKSLFAFTVQDYLAASLNTNTALVDKLKQAYLELKAEGLINLH
ncbi:substrate-binding periplasmic protein [Colwelliaceae bacterium 6471]